MEKFHAGDIVKVVRMDIKDIGYTGIKDQKLCLGEKGKVVTVSEKVGVIAVNFNNCTFSINPKWVELVERRRKPYNGKVVCVGCDTDKVTLFKIGKVYKVIDGDLYDETMSTWRTASYSIDDINRMVNTPCNLGLKFIEFKGYAD